MPRKARHPARIELEILTEAFIILADVMDTNLAITVTRSEVFAIRGVGERVDCTSELCELLEWREAITVDLVEDHLPIRFGV